MPMLRSLTAAVFLSLSAAASAQMMEEVPFITTPDNVTLEMLRIAQVNGADHVIDLGSGDGRIVITAARQFGARGLGVEIVPDLVAKSIEHARRAGVAERTEFRVQDIFQTDLSAATVVTMYLLPEFNLRLRPDLLALAPGTRIVSHDWDMGEWRPERTVVVPVPDKVVGREKFSRVHLWRVPAPVDGLWCGEANAQRLRFVQHFQYYRATLEGAPQGHAWSGRIDGAALPPPVGGPALELQGNALHVKAGAAGVAAGARFTRARDGQCPA